MADYTVDEIIAVKASQYVGDTRIPILTDLADGQLTNCIQGNDRNYAIALQVLHWLVMADRVSEDADSGGGLAVGAVTKRKEGELELWYGDRATDAPKHGTDLSQELKQTPFGMELYSFLKRFGVYVYTRAVGTCGVRTLLPIIPQ